MWGHRLCERGGVQGARVVAREWGCLRARRDRRVSETKRRDMARHKKWWAEDKKGWFRREACKDIMIL